MTTVETDRKNRLYAFIVITLVFLFSVAALLYWAVNVAAANINMKAHVQFQALISRGAIAELEATPRTGTLVQLKSSVKACPFS